MRSNFVVVVFLLLQIAPYISFAQDSEVVAQNGILDLTKLNKEKNFSIPLNGEWNFFWKQLIEPGMHKDYAGRKELLPVPGTWDKKYRNQGYATYSLTIYLPEWIREKKLLALKIPIIHSSAKIWINDNLLVENGEVAIEEEADHTVSIGKKIITFSNESKTLCITVHISNYKTGWAGPADSFILGDVISIKNSREKEFALNMIFFSFFTLIALLSLMFFFFYPKQKEYLYFSIASMIAALRIVLWRESIFFNIDSILFLYTKAVLFLVPLWHLAVIMYIFHIFPKSTKKGFIYSVQFLSLFYLILYSFTPPTIKLWSSSIFLIVVVLIMLCGIDVSLREFKENKQISTLFLLSVLLLSFFGFYDILLSLRIIKSGTQISSFGFTMFLIMQAIVLSKRYSDSFKLVEKMNKDITEANLRLQNLDKLKDQFLANTSHELRTPLNGIIGLTESIIDNVDHKTFDKKIIYNLKTIKHCGIRLATQINDLLDISKLKHKSIHISKQSLDIVPVIENVILISKAQLKGKPLTFGIKISEDISSVYGDPNRIMQILFNLVGNAIKFTVKGKIDIQAVEKDEMVHISVSDTGIGIASDKIEDIFKSFEQVDSGIEKKYGGTGLGLYITQQLVELHGGTIDCHSVIGAGSVFTFTLPKGGKIIDQFPYEDLIAPGFIDDDFVIKNDENMAENMNFKIALIDDEKINHDVVSNFLLDKNYSLTRFFSGKSFLESMDQGYIPDLILLDIMMPEISGYDVCSKIRELYLPYELPVILLTAKNRKKDMTEGFMAGANDYILKPFSKDELIARIEAHLNIKLNVKAILDYQQEEVKEMKELNESKYGRSRLEESFVEKSSAELLYLFEVEKIYKDPNVSRMFLAEKLSLSQNDLSQVINRKFNCTLNTLINNYRVEEAKRLMNDDTNRCFSTLELGLQAGFKSKTHFITTFKKFTDTTPKKFQMNTIS